MLKTGDGSSRGCGGLLAAMGCLVRVIICQNGVIFLPV